MSDVRARPFSEHGSRLPHHAGSSTLRVLRRHVDLLRVSSALCPGSTPRR
ncbi:hypothetical protein OG233_01065 [Streptomyces sp. NBC_01218]|nr:MULTISPECIES: putative leader peptide [unclassified Streptomyces]WEH38210.1 hypothetical protein PZB77_01065 [Streptomyces sp. AM 2-1-1]WSQ49871.1 hypothetical protein OG233_01065 [Streptomyces sp. NBC_01218]